MEPSYLQIKAPGSKLAELIFCLKKRIKLKHACANVLTQKGSFRVPVFWVEGPRVRRLRVRGQVKSSTHLCKIIPPSAVTSSPSSSCHLFASDPPSWFLFTSRSGFFFSCLNVLFKILVNSDPCRPTRVTAAAANLRLRNRVMRSRDGR